MGELYVGMQGELPGFHKLCAVKKLLPELSQQPEFFERFCDEARLVISMAHPNVVSVYEMGSVGPEYFMAMELVHGKDLARVLKRSAHHNNVFDVRAALYVTQQLLSALEYCHRHTDGCGGPLQLVHRDVSPPNVLLSYEGHVKLADFGLALSSVKRVKTNPRVVLGRLGYLSPEQITGGAVDHRADLFSVGVLLFEMLTGERFAAGRSPPHVLELMRERSQLPPSRLRRGVPQVVDLLVRRALAIDPAQRYKSAREFRDVLRRVLARIDPVYSASDFAEAVMQRLFEPERERTKLRRLVDRVDAEDLWPGSERSRTSTVAEAFALASVDAAPHGGGAKPRDRSGLLTLVWEPDSSYEECDTDVNVDFGTVSRENSGPISLN